jgi:site-specific recombinase XerD
MNGLFVGRKPRRLGVLACGSTTSASRRRSAAARDRAYWSKWWAPSLGVMLPHMVTQRDITAVIDAMEQAGRAPLTIKTHRSVIKAFFGWMVEEDV